MLLTQQQRAVSSALHKGGYIPNWHSTFGKPYLVIFLNENEDERLVLYFSSRNIYYDYRIDLSAKALYYNVPKPIQKRLFKALDIINEVLPENKDPQYNYLKKFDHSYFEAINLDENEE